VTEPAVRILVADDHPLYRRGLAALLDAQEGWTVVAEATDGIEAVTAAHTHQPDVVVMDLRMPGVDGIAAAKSICAEFPDARIIALTSYDGDQEIYRALEAGVRGYLLKEMVHTEVVRAIRIVHAGKRLMPPEVAERLSEYFPKVALTPREVEVLTFVAKGLSNKEIGDRLGAAGGTVKMHVQHILSKLGVADRTHAVTVAIQRGIITLDS
jgi:DNA-binding NarL/FixJ family response regulator